MYLKVCVSIVILVSTIPFGRLDFIEDLVEAENYPIEKYTIHTKDGYILPLYRIPATHSKRPNGKVVLLQHALTCSASCFLMFGRKSAAYYFADAGYDVWMGNNRGTRFAREHETMSPDDPKFWDFSWHELGVLDLPATIDFILKRTKAKKISYVGHSQSVTILFVFLAEYPQYNDKIHVAHLMTPTIMFKYIHPAATMVRSIDVIHEIENLMLSMRQYESISFTPLYRGALKLFHDFCLTKNGKRLCPAFFAFLNGSSKYFSTEIYSRISEHIPAGASYKQIIHYLQNGVTRSFRQYNHGEEKNMMIYGTVEPPLYNLSNVQANIHMLYGTHDAITPATNIAPLNDVLGRKIAVQSKFEGYGHVEFAFVNLDRVYGKILRVDKQFD